jgi:hypothetical protein
LTFSESTSGKSSDRQAWKSSALGVVPGDGTELRRGNTYEQGESGRGEGGKETDGCPLTGGALANAIPLRKVLLNVLSSSLSPTNAPLELTSRRCKGSSVRFLTSSFLSYSPPYSYVFSPHLCTTSRDHTPKPTTFVFKV